MNTIDNKPDYDESDTPRGTGAIRVEGGVTWFHWQGSWWPVSSLPKEGIAEYLSEQADKKRQ